jgi:hypothetical protein
VLFDGAKSTKNAFGEINSPSRVEQYFAIFVIPTGKATTFFSLIFNLFFFSVFSPRSLRLCGNQLPPTAALVLPPPLVSFPPVFYILFQ